MPDRERPSARPDRPGENVRRRTRIAAVALLLLVPFGALLAVGTYAEETPRLWGFPFFYWYQLLWVLLTAACLGTAHLVRPAEEGRYE